MPTSPACVTCSRLRVKCDKTPLACVTCEKVGRKCEGYPGSWRMRQSHWTSICTDASSKVARGDRSRQKGQQFKFRVSSQPPRPAASSKLPLTPAVSLCGGEVLRAQLIHHLNHRPTSLAGSYRASSLFLEFLPSRINISGALDEAVRCICSVQELASQHPSLQTNVRQQALYCSALKALQGELSLMQAGGTKAQQSYVLATVQLLQMFEQSTNYQSMNWIRHAGGSIRLIENLGPKFFADDLQILILESQLGRITFECIRQDRSVFLDSPEWLAAIRKSKSIPVGDSTRFDNELAYQEIIIRFPGVLHRYKKFCNPPNTPLSGSGDSPTADQHRSTQSQHSTEQDREAYFLITAIAGFRQSLSHWRNEFQKGRAAEQANSTPQSGAKLDATKDLALAHRTRIEAGLNFASTAFLLFATCMELDLLERAMRGSFYVTLLESDNSGETKFDKDRYNGLKSESELLSEAALQASRGLRKHSRVGNRILGSALLEVWSALMVRITTRPDNEALSQLMDSLGEPTAKWLEDDL